MAGLYGGTIFGGGGCETLGGSGGSSNPKVLHFSRFSTHLRQLRGYSALTDFIKHQSIGAPQGPLHTLVWIFEYVTDWLFRRPLSVDFLRFLDVSKSWRNSGALDIRNFDPKICMRVPIYLTRFNKNKKKFHVDRSPSYGRSSKRLLGGRNIGRPFAARRVDNFHAMSFGNCRGPF